MSCCRASCSEAHTCLQPRARSSRDKHQACTSKGRSNKLHGTGMARRSLQAAPARAAQRPTHPASARACMHGRMLSETRCTSRSITFGSTSARPPGCAAAAREGRVGWGWKVSGDEPAAAAPCGPPGGRSTAGQVVCKRRHAANHQPSRACFATVALNACSSLSTGTRAEALSCTQSLRSRRMPLCKGQGPGHTHG